MPTECQTQGVRNDWVAAHEAYDKGTMPGIRHQLHRGGDGLFHERRPALHLRDGRGIPDSRQYFCSAMAQTDPNRRYLISGTSLGLIDDSLPLELPPNGVIFDQFNKHGITWKDYYSSSRRSGCILPLHRNEHSLPRHGQDR